MNKTALNSGILLAEATLEQNDHFGDLSEHLNATDTCIAFSRPSALDDDVSLWLRSPPSREENTALVTCRDGHFTLSAHHRRPLILMRS